MSLGLAAAIGAVLSVPVLGYLLTPLIRPPQPQWIDLGQITQFDIGTTRLVAFTDLSPLPWAGLTARTAVYVRRTTELEFTVFAVNCTHLGCPVNWLETAELFVCPCHGGVFYRNGDVAAGPPPRPLSEYLTRVADGHLFVQTRPLTTTARPLED
jgi:menaquinol-cytochrome c reductase iron-sulfur subunit